MILKLHIFYIQGRKETLLNCLRNLKDVLTFFSIIFWYWDGTGKWLLPHEKQRPLSYNVISMAAHVKVMYGDTASTAMVFFRDISASAATGFPSSYVPWPFDDAVVILKMSSQNTCYGLISWTLFEKLLSGKCHITPLMRSLVLVQLMAWSCQPILTPNSVIIWCHSAAMS